MSSPKLFTAILIDDDNISNLIQTKLLTHTGRFDSLLTFCNPAEAYKHIEVNCFKLQTTALADLLLIDINMPIINGFQLIEQIKLLYPSLLEQTAVCILSSSANEDDVLMAKEIEIDHLLTKPLTPYDITYIIDLLESKTH